MQSYSIFELKKNNILFYHNQFFFTSVFRVYVRDARNANVHDVRDVRNAKKHFDPFRILEILLTIGKNIIQFWSVML